MKKGRGSSRRRVAHAAPIDVHLYSAECGCCDHVVSAEFDGEVDFSAFLEEAVGWFWDPLRGIWMCDVCRSAN